MRLSKQENTQICQLLLNPKAINGSDDDKAILAWDDVLYMMNRAGAYNSVAFKDRAIMKAIDLLRWLDKAQYYA